MLDGGADARYLARRIVRMAWEDIGLADPRAARIALDAAETYERLGTPEGELAMAQREQAKKELNSQCAGGPRRCVKIPASYNEYPPHPMLDIQLLRKDLDGVAKRLADRGYNLDVAAFAALEAERRDTQTRTEEMQAR